LLQNLLSSCPFQKERKEIISKKFKKKIYHHQLPSLYCYLFPLPRRRPKEILCCNLTEKKNSPTKKEKVL